MAHDNNTTSTRVAAGPFDVASGKRESEAALADALITGMLVVYPVLATVVAMMVGLAFAGAVT